MRRLIAAFAASAFAFAAPAGAQQPSVPDVEAVLASAAAALGAGNLAHLPSYVARGTGTLAGLPATVVSYTDVAHAGRFATYARLPLLSQDGGYDGSASWSRDAKGVVWVDGSEQGRAAAINEAYRESYALWTPAHGGAKISLAAPKIEAGKTYDVVRVEPPGSAAPYDVWIDRATHLPSRFVETTAAVTTTTALSDYRPVAGVMLAFSSHETTDTGNEQDVRVKEVEVAPPDLATKVSKPVSDVHDFSIAGGTETTVPALLGDNHVYVDVMLNGKGPFRMIFDTGGANVIDPAVVREIGASPAGSVQGSGVGAATEDFAFAPVRSLRVGQAELRDQVFAVLPVRAGFGVSASVPADGLIGWEVLARYVTVFDYANKRITLRMPGTGTADPAGTSVGFVFNGTQPEIPCLLDGIASQCTIDTGSRASLDILSPFVAAHPQLLPANATQAGIGGFGVGGAATGRLGRLPSLRIGSYDLTNLIAGFSDATSGAFAAPGVAANIGGGALKRFTVTFDYGHQTMSLIPNAAFASPDEGDRSGIFAINQGKIVVADVRGGTPAAAAGIKKGDTILAAGSLQGTRLTLAALREAFREPSGTQLRLTIRSKGADAARSVTLTLRDYV